MLSLRKSTIESWSAERISVLSVSYGNCRVDQLSGCEESCLAIHLKRRCDNSSNRMATNDCDHGCPDQKDPDRKIRTNGLIRIGPDFLSGPGNHDCDHPSTTDRYVTYRILHLRGRYVTGYVTSPYLPHSPDSRVGNQSSLNTRVRTRVRVRWTLLVTLISQWNFHWIGISHFFPLDKSKFLFLLSRCCLFRNWRIQSNCKLCLY